MEIGYSIKNLIIKTKKMKKIGIVGWNTGENSFGASKSYLTWLSLFGDVQILLPKKGVVEGLDLLVLPGGPDLSPNAYDEVPGFNTGNSDLMKQYFYDNNLDQYLKLGVPIFGICLGFQQLCAKFGGKLEQHYPYPYSSKARWELVEPMYFNFETSSANEFLKDIKAPTKKEPYKINSLHHQGCHALPANVEVLGYSDYNNIEAARFGENIFGVQYHPEETYDAFSRNIINYLLKQ